MRTPISPPASDPVTAEFRVTVTVDRNEWAEEFGIDPADVPADLADYVNHNCAWTVGAVTNLGGTVTTAPLTPAES